MAAADRNLTSRIPPRAYTPRADDGDGSRCVCSRRATSIPASRSAGRSTCRSRRCCCPSRSGRRRRAGSALPAWAMLESNINQTAASSAAAIVSSGLVAPIPALAMMTGANLPWTTLAVWVFAVSFLGVWVGWYLRPRLIVDSNLVFPAGMATAETMRDLFSHGREAMRRVSMLLGSLSVAAAINAIDDLLWQIPRLAPSLTAQKLTIALDPSLLLLGFGGIIGLRAGIGLLAGAILAWGVVAPRLIDHGIVDVSGTDNWFQPLVGWLLWPGVTMMVTASLTSFAISVVAAARNQRLSGATHQPEVGLHAAARRLCRRRGDDRHSPDHVVRHSLDHGAPRHSARLRARGDCGASGRRDQRGADRGDRQGVAADLRRARPGAAHHQSDDRQCRWRRRGSVRRPAQRFSRRPRDWREPGTAGRRPMRRRVDGEPGGQPGLPQADRGSRERVAHAGMAGAGGRDLEGRGRDPRPRALGDSVLGADGHGHRGRGRSGARARRTACQRAGSAYGCRAAPPSDLPSLFPPAPR